MVVCVSDYAARKAVVDAEQLGPVLSGRTILQLTTGTAMEARAHDDWARQCNARVVDGALMCFSSQVGTEEAAVLVAGALPVFDDCRDILTVLASNITYLEDNVAAPAILDLAALSAGLGLLMGIANGAAVCAAGSVLLGDGFVSARLSNPERPGIRKPAGGSAAEARCSRTGARDKRRAAGGPTARLPGRA